MPNNIFSAIQDGNGGLIVGNFQNEISPEPFGAGAGAGSLKVVKTGTTYSLVVDSNAFNVNVNNASINCSNNIIIETLDKIQLKCHVLTLGSSTSRPTLEYPNATNTDLNSLVCKRDLNSLVNLIFNSISKAFLENENLTIEEKKELLKSEAQYIIDNIHKEENSQA